MFDIREHIEFDRNGRAFCPSCEIKKGRRPRQKSLAIVPGSNGAYLCHAGCSVEEIREAMGQPKRDPSIRHIASAPKVRESPLPQPDLDKLYNPIQVGKFVGMLLNGQAPDAVMAREWLRARGITSEMILHYQLGLMTYPKGIGIPIPLDEQGEKFSIKTRKFPLSKDNQDPWSQKGIPASVFFGYCPESATQTWLCEGEWDAMLLGWIVRESGIQNIAVASFTCGCKSVAVGSQLDRLPGEVILFYDLDLPGREGSVKVGSALAKRGQVVRIAQVPAPKDPPKGWDISDALNHGLTLADIQKSADEAVIFKLEEQPPQLGIQDAVIRLVAQPLSSIERQVKVLDLAMAYGKQPRDIEKLLQACELDLDRASEFESALDVLPQLQKLENQRLNLHRILPPALADALTLTAAAMPTTSEALLTTLIPVLGSRIGTSSRIVIKASSNYVQPAIYRTAIVANTGDRKTPTQMAILSPLYDLEREAAQKFESAMEVYQEEMRTHQEGEPFPTKPVRKRYIINQGSYEGKIRVHSENRRGLLDYTDELAGRFARMNQYRHGYGDDAFNDLSEFNGGPLSRDKVGGSDYLPRTAISSTGSIQWETLRQLQEQAGSDDHAGVWARWLFCAVPLPPALINLDDSQPDPLSPLLKSLYIQLDELPDQDFFLSDAAKQRFQTWQHSLVHRTQAEIHPALKAAYPKLESYGARLALLLHCVWAVVEAKKPDPVISGETMQRAIELTNWFAGQMRLVLAHNSPLKQTEGELLKILNVLKRRGSVTAREIRNYCWTLRTKPLPEIRQMMVRLAHSGFATLTGEGERIRLCVESVAAVVEEPLHAETLSQSEIQQFVATVEGEGGVEKNGNYSVLDPPDFSTQGGDPLYTPTAMSEIQIEQEVEPVETDLSTPLHPSTSLCCSPPQRLPLLQVGDICRYVGSHGVLGVTCRGRDLKVLEVKGSVATVNALKDFFHHHEWIHPYDIEIQYLRKRS
ncbi:MAG: DUF3987 domain-containing protein [Cyanobacteriota bacterium]|nr:DUF3987 domain-containing protein [Cyanobacteriota bacterium]